MSEVCEVLESVPDLADSDRIALGKDALRQAFLENLSYVQGKFPALATRKDYDLALAYTMREYCAEIWQAERVPISLTEQERLALMQ